MYFDCAQYKQKGFAPILIIFSAVLLLVVVGGAYYFGKSIIKPVDNDSRACTMEAKICPDGSSIGRTGPNCEFAQCPTVTPAKSADETANWKTYTNAKYSYSIKYPPNWSIDESMAESIHFYPKHLTLEMQEKLRGWGPFKEPEVFVNVLLQPYEKPVLTEFDLKTSSIEPQVIKVGNIEGYYYQKSSVPISPIMADFPLRSNQTLQFGLITAGQENIDAINKELHFLIQDPSEDIFKQMIVSFKFIDKNQEINNCSDGFKYYDGEAYSICYPKNATVKVDKFTGKNNKTTIQTEFDDSTDIIVVASNDEAGLEQNRCLFPEQVVVGNLSAVRYTQKRPTANNTCGDIYQFFTFINNGGLTYRIIDTKRQFLTDNFIDTSEYKIMEQSLKLKNP